jgi:aminoglycoside N3'-acetyltransferase
MTFWLATLATRHFDFEAVGVTEDAAREALAAGLAHHAEQHSLDQNWTFDMLNDANVRLLALGACYRDGTLIH